MKALRVLSSVGALTLLLGWCSDEKPVATAPQAESETTLKKDCDDPKWREQNLGLWYSVCRRPLRW